jgi:YD repeat-containing protein
LKEFEMKDSFNMFVRAFVYAGREDQFSKEGLRAICDYISEIEVDTGKKVDIDVIGICCNYTEYESALEAAADYGIKAKTEDEALRDSEGRELSYKDSYGNWSKCTYDENGNELSYQDSDGRWVKCTYNERGQELTYQDSSGDMYERNYDADGYELSYQNNRGHWYKYVRDADGRLVSYKDSNGDCSS